MNSSRSQWLCVIGLLVLCFGLAAWLDPQFESMAGRRNGSADVLSVLLGDGRRIFANHFFVKADAYFHSGYYPTVFDNREAFQTPHMAEDAGALAGQNKGDESGFLGKPRDWIDAFSRQFFPSVHTHLDEGGPQGQARPTGDLGASSDVRDLIVHNWPPIPWKVCAFAVLYAVAYATAFLFAACLIFRRRALN